MKPYAYRFYHSRAWRMVSYAYMASRHWLCERCAAKGIIKAARICHHKVWLNEINIGDPSVSLSAENLEALCMDCHNAEHMTSMEVAFDNSGNVISLEAEEHKNLEKNEKDLGLLLEKLGD